MRTVSPIAPSTDQSPVLRWMHGECIVKHYLVMQLQPIMLLNINTHWWIFLSVFVNEINTGFAILTRCPVSALVYVGLMGLKVRYKVPQSVTLVSQSRSTCCAWCSCVYHASFHFAQFLLHPLRLSCTPPPTVQSNPNCTKWSYQRHAPTTTWRLSWPFAWTSRKTWSIAGKLGFSLVSGLWDWILSAICWLLVFSIIFTRDPQFQSWKTCLQNHAS